MAVLATDTTFNSGIPNRSKSKNPDGAPPASKNSSLPSVRSCDRNSAENAMRLLRDPQMVSRVVVEDGWVVVTFGSDYLSWDERQKEGLVTTYANADACLSGKARRLEFRGPSGTLVARADELRGIKMR